MKSIVILFLLLLLVGCADKQTGWEQIMANKELRFVTIEGPATYYNSKAGPMGFEYELARRFASEIGVELSVIVVPNAYSVISAIKEGKAALGGAALMANTRLGELRFGPPYLEVAQQLVYRRDAAQPKSLQNVSSSAINISSLHLDKIKDRYPHFVWNAYYDKDVESLLKMVQENEISSAIATSNIVKIYKHLYPDIEVAFDVTPPQPLAWVYKKDDERLHAAVMAFFDKITKSGELKRLVNFYYEHIAEFNYVDVRTFLERIDERLPEYENAFKKTAKKHNLDWTLLAAMGYQESHWEADARSPTGVRGLMMLTEAAAEEVDVEDRLSPRQSIEGGARYLQLVMDKVPERIQQPDRLWFALAAYNVGFQHLEDARILTQQQGADPDRWSDVRQYLPLLSDEEWHKDTRYGYARGGEPVHYVRKIRTYHDVLRWALYEREKNRPDNSTLQALLINVPAL